jgi:hypothetical protein
MGYVLLYWLWIDLPARWRLGSLKARAADSLGDHLDAHALVGARRVDLPVGV